MSGNKTSCSLLTTCSISSFSTMTVRSFTFRSKRWRSPNRRGLVNVTSTNYVIAKIVLRITIYVITKIVCPRDRTWTSCIDFLFLFGGNLSDHSNLFFYWEEKKKEFHFYSREQRIQLKAILFYWHNLNICICSSATCCMISILWFCSTSELLSTNANKELNRKTAVFDDEVSG